MFNNPCIKIKYDLFRNILVVIADTFKFPDDGKEFEGLPGFCRIIL